MKLTPLFLLIFSISVNLKADCLGWFNIYPNKDQIHQNSIFILEEYAFFDYKLDRIQTETKITLQAHDHSIPLLIIDSCKGMFFLNQVILKPSQKLKRGVKYHLKIEGLRETKEAFIPTKWNYLKQENETIYWTVSKEEYNTPPIWIAYPLYEKADIQYYGCGPAINSLFSYKIGSKVTTFIKTEFYDLTDNKLYTSYLNISQDNAPDEYGIFEVGHDMCAGAFIYVPKHKYKTRFKLIDICGNEDSQWTSWTKIKNPMNNYRK